MVHPLSHLFVVALANRGAGQKERIELRHIGRRQDDLDRRGIAFEVRTPFRPWDGNGWTIAWAANQRLKLPPRDRLG